MSANPPMSCDPMNPEAASECSSHMLRRTASVQSLNSAFSHLSSSTMTASDLPGPGRILDKYVFTKGGRALERVIGRVAHSLGLGPVAATLRIGANLRGFSLHDSPSSLSFMTSEIPVHRTLRLELGLVQDVPRLRADCKKLFDYTRSNLLSTRILALNMIITLYIRFPYLSSYFDTAEVTEYARNARTPFFASEDDLLEDSLARMAFACLAPVDNSKSVARLVDHLAEQTKRSEENTRAQSSGPWYYLLPDTQVIRKCCENPNTSFAALRFTGIIFRHSFLSRADEFYVKLNIATITGFWDDLIECMKHHVSIEMARPCRCSCLRHCLNETGYTCAAQINDMSSTEEDLEGIDLFSETVLEMLYRALAWDPLLTQMKPRFAALRDALIRDAVEIFRPPLAQTLFPSASFIALMKLEPQLEIVYSTSCSEKASCGDYSYLPHD